MTPYFTNTMSIPAWRAEGYWEYLLIANPDRRVYQKVKGVKQEFAAKHGRENVTITDPHITLCVLLCKEGEEQELVNVIQRACSPIKAPTIILDDYKGFNHSVIYIQIQNHEPFNRLKKRLKMIDDFLQVYNYPAVQFKTPHMTLVRGLSDHKYDSVIYEYRQKKFFDFFTMKELILLKRPYDGHKCQHVNKFSLLPNDGPIGPIYYQLKFDL